MKIRFWYSVTNIVTLLSFFAIYYGFISFGGPGDFDPDRRDIFAIYSLIIIFSAIVLIILMRKIRQKLLKRYFNELGKSSVVNR